MQVASQLFGDDKSHRRVRVVHRDPGCRIAQGASIHKRRVLVGGQHAIGGDPRQFRHGKECFACRTLDGRELRRVDAVGRSDGKRHAASAVVRSGIAFYATA